MDNPAKSTAYFYGVDRELRPVFHCPNHGYYCAVTEFLDDPTDPQEVGEIIDLINSGEVALYHKGDEPDGEPSHEVHGVTVSFPASYVPSKKSEKPPAKLSKLFNNYQLCLHLIEHGYFTCYKLVSGIYKTDQYLYQIVKRGRKMDAVSLHTFRMVYEALNEKNREALLKLPFERAVSIAYKVTTTKQ